MENSTSVFRTGYIIGPRADMFWFVGLPFIAVGVAIVCDLWFTAIALGMIQLSITVPHHFATWLRTYGFAEDWKRWWDRLILAPMLIIGATVAGLIWAPLTVLVVTMLWDHQHSIMQQHGFARIYDFKAKSGAPSTRRFDLALHWFLYVNLFLTSPLFTMAWLHQLYEWHIPVSEEAVATVHLCSWTATSIYLAIYIAHLVITAIQGHKINPLKYVFIGASYFLWYYTAWLPHSVNHALTWGIAHRMMHGLQYIVIVYWYLRRKADDGTLDAATAEKELKPPKESKKPKKSSAWLVWSLVKPGHVAIFGGVCLMYAVFYSLLIGESWFGFNLFNGGKALNVKGQSDTGIYAATLVNAFAMIHYYFDSFIWKVRDTKTQGGL